MEHPRSFSGDAGVSNARSQTPWAGGLGESHSPRGQHGGPGSEQVSQQNRMGSGPKPTLDLVMPLTSISLSFVLYKMAQQHSLGFL